MYCADAEVSVNVVRAFSCPVLAYNCEVQLSQEHRIVVVGLKKGTECSIHSPGWYTHAVRQVSDK
ncbi:MAG: diadenosine tetraphosphatase, partial [Amylibacter sp.]